jgi:hypothetical protein
MFSLDRLRFAGVVAPNVGTHAKKTSAGTSRNTMGTGPPGTSVDGFYAANVGNMNMNIGFGNLRQNI